MFLPLIVSHKVYARSQRWSKPRAKSQKPGCLPPSWTKKSQRGSRYKSSWSLGSVNARKRNKGRERGQKSQGGKKKATERAGQRMRTLCLLLPPPLSDPDPVFYFSFRWGFYFSPGRARAWARTRERVQALDIGGGIYDPMPQTKLVCFFLSFFSSSGLLSRQNRKR